MSTKQIKKSTTNARSTKAKTTKAKRETNPELSEGTREALEKGIPKTIPLELIDFNPKNRRYYKQKNLEAFGELLKKQGQIHEIIVVEIPGGRYKLVVGERRVKGSLIAGLKTIRASIVVLTEEQEKEIMFSENDAREDRHPLDDAALIALMQQDNLSMQEIALRLVKPLPFVYNRIKLNSLIDPLKEIFVEEKMNIKEALKLASLSEDSQQDFFNDHCTDWRDDEYFSLEDMEDVLSHYLYDLKKAPFNTEDKQLIADVGACTKCPFNSATEAGLFPELAEQAICRNKACYGNKCTAHYNIQVRTALLDEKPEAIIFTNYFKDEVREIIQSLPETANLPLVDYYNIDVVPPPEAPKRETYSEINAKGELVYFDENNFNDALAEHENDKQEFELMIHAGDVQKALFVGQKEIKTGYFRKSNQSAKSSIPQQTKKQVDDAIKADTATPKLLEDEILRMEEEKNHALDLGKRKVQMCIHKDFTDNLKTPSNCKQIIDSDIIATRIFIYNCLDVNAVDEVNKAFSIARDFGYERRYEILSQLTESQTAYLIRKAVQSKSDSKYPQNLIGFCLHSLAQNWGVDRAGIEERQAKITEGEIKNFDDRIEAMKARLETMKIKES